MAPLCVGFIEGVKAGVVGGLVGLAVGLVIGVGWFFGLLVVKTRVVKLVDVIRPDFLQVAVVALFYIVTLALTFFPATVVIYIVRFLNHHIF